MLDRNNSKPLWEQLETILREKIDGGVLNPGDMIGSEQRLSQEYLISRMTVRSVLTRLVQEGILYRVAGKGTYVAEPKIPTRPLANMGIREQLEDKGLEIRTEVLENRVIMPDDRVARKLCMDKNNAVYFIERIRYMKGKPLSIHRTYLKRLVNPLISDTRLAEEQLCNILKDDYLLAPTYTKETLELVFANEDQAHKLNMKVAQPLLYLKERRYVNDAIFEYSEVFFRGDQIVIQLEYQNDKTGDH
jgi:GntR family transcriptional regulator